MKPLKPLTPFVRRSLRPNRFIPAWLFISILISILLYSCVASPQQSFDVQKARVSFNSNGERIYLTASSDRINNLSSKGDCFFVGIERGDRINNLFSKSDRYYCEA